uniref:Uncharacterized protein n=1 Tax=Eiseniibacteriota bacterium TaxID=2212470 RepID=A0A832I4Y9_UNCEI
MPCPFASLVGLGASLGGAHTLLVRDRAWRLAAWCALALLAGGWAAYFAWWRTGAFRIALEVLSVAAIVAGALRVRRLRRTRGWTPPLHATLTRLSAAVWTVAGAPAVLALKTALAVAAAGEWLGLVHVPAAAYAALGAAFAVAVAARLAALRRARRERAPRAATLALLPAAIALAAALAPAPARAAGTDTALVQLRAEAKALAPLARTALGRRFLEATAHLPAIPTRQVYHDSARTRWYADHEARALPDSARARLVPRALDEGFYYTTRYGSPLAYLRALEILAGVGLDDVAGRRIADFGYGSIGHLRLLASLGADVHGIDVDPMLRAIYAWPGDQGRVAGAGDTAGTLTLHAGLFPAGRDIARAVGAGYDVFMSKNTLKRGYIHPEQKADPRTLVHLGVSDTAYVRHVAAILKPAGLFLIYNLSPAPNAPGTPYRPWADGRSPFPRELLEAEGLEVLAFELDDTPNARAVARALGWDRGPGAMDLEKDLFAQFTLARRRR